MSTFSWHKPCSQKTGKWAPAYTKRFFWGILRQKVGGGNTLRRVPCATGGLCNMMKKRFCKSLQMHNSADGKSAKMLKSLGAERWGLESEWDEGAFVQAHSKCLWDLFLCPPSSYNLLPWLHFEPEELGLKQHDGMFNLLNTVCYYDSQSVLSSPEITKLKTNTLRLKI